MGEVVSWGDGVSRDIEMRENNEALRALAVLDHNKKEGLKAIADGSTKIGAWKRQVGAKGKENKTQQGGGNDMEKCKDSLCGKKRFCLRDEEKAMQSLNQAEKKVQLNSEVGMSDTVVEVASQKYAQSYQ